MQKPGYDLYGSTTIFMFILCIFIFSFYDDMSVSQAEPLSKANNSNVFDGNMIMNLLFVVCVMILERYANRSDTKAVSCKGLLNENLDKRYYHDDKKMQKPKNVTISALKTNFD